MSDFKISNFGATVTATSPAGSADVIYTVPARHHTEIKYMAVSNTDALAIEATVELYDSKSGSYFSLCKNLHLAGSGVDGRRDMIVGSGEELHLNSGDKIVASTNSTGDLDICISAKEYYRDSTR